MNTSFLPMLIIGVLFFIFGFVTWLNGSLIPYLKLMFELNEFQALFVTFAFYIAYTVMALPMSYILNKTGYKKGMQIGLMIMAIGSLIFILAAKMVSFISFLIALFPLGTGLTILQTASNPYVVYLGPQKSAAMRISIMGIINKLAGILAPLVFTALILSDLKIFTTTANISYELLANKLIIPYLTMAIILVLLVGLIKFSHLPEIEFEDNNESNISIFKFKNLIFGAIALFFYVGVEVIAGDTIGLYGKSLSIEHFSILTSYVMSFMVIGYILGVVLIPKFLSTQKALLLSSLSGVILSFAILFSSQNSFEISNFLWGWLGVKLVPNSVTFVALLGLSNALIWPTIWPLALKGLGKHTPQGSAILIMAIAGGALIPLIFGKIGQITQNLQLGYSILIPSYIIIFWYSYKGYKQK